VVYSQKLTLLVGAAGLEPATVGLEIRCSIRLSYAPIGLILQVFESCTAFSPLSSTTFTKKRVASFPAEANEPDSRLKIPTLKFYSIWRNRVGE
jgi:hypothetical protein